jgi:peptide chain release factor 1
MGSIPDIQPFRKRLEELDARMARPDFFQDPQRAAELSREHQRMSRIVDLGTELEASLKALRENEQLIDDDDAEADLRTLAREEIPVIEDKLEQLERAILFTMIPPEPEDGRNIIMEIRAGAGGEEAALFAADLARMYTRYAEAQNWRIEPMGTSPADAGGFKETIFKIAGDSIYQKLKFESGVHRVQRVPVTEASGRIHTSTATVAVLPEAEEVDIEINPNDLDISTMRASGAGGQHVNTTDSAVMMVHKPTGTTVYCADERSQIKNRAKAMTVMRSRLLQAKREEERSKYAAHRRGQIGTGDRSERIRTYNYPQSRLTDHRIGLSLSLPSIMEGELDPLLEGLAEADLSSKVADLLRNPQPV